mmetsp:Transcript_9456/g.15179  ORF Transcript_9456/g.15179 Transcript_9456/m.15179 type:complete len:103 (+) Transcript_9456:608-916(+)
MASAARTAVASINSTCKRRMLRTLFGRYLGARSASLSKCVERRFRGRTPLRYRKLGRGEDQQVNPKPEFKSGKIRQKENEKSNSSTASNGAFIYIASHDCAK